jgi:hypothetical protein
MTNSISASIPGIYADVENDAYHAAPGVSKSGLWTIYTKTPSHYRFADRKESKAFDLGEAIHLAVLQPDVFETRVMRGPKDRRGNNWKDFQAEAAATKRLLLTEGDFEKSLEVRDVVHADAWLNALIVNAASEIEHSALWIDDETGAICRCRPDLYRPDLGIMLDLKSTVDASADPFARSVVNYGYHAQEAWYSDGYRALGRKVDGFVFLALEKERPYARAVYELPPSIVDDGRAIMRKAVATYAQCAATDQWPGYASGVNELKFKAWSYVETAAPVGEEV